VLIFFAAATRTGAVTPWFAINTVCLFILMKREWVLKEFFEISKNWTTHPTEEISNTIIIPISENDKGYEFLNDYANAELYSPTR
jgi:hypothetical protein